MLLLILSCRGVQTQEPLVVRESYHDLSEWEVLQMAIVMTESKGNPDAVGKTDDKGIMQITPIYVAEVNRLSGKGYSHDDAFSIEKSLEMFDIIQSRHNPEMDIDKAISLHNRSKAYSYRVKQNMEIVRRMEAVRKAMYDERRH